jgi:hypothetical protein
MKRIILIISIMLLLFTACSNKNENESNLSYNEKDDEIMEQPSDEIDRSEYLTGEIITDGNYSFPTGYTTDYKGALYFVPDAESSQILKEKYSISGESLAILYDDMSKLANLPKELGIYKVRVKVDNNNTYNYLMLNDIQLTEKIGTVLYQGKTYATNELDENVKVKDKVCGLIVKWISKDEETDGVQIRFAGDIETEGYYFINYSEMYGYNYGLIYFDEKYFNDIPMYINRGQNNFLFAKSNEFFDKLENFSSFGRGRFKNTNYQLVYNIGMGRSSTDYLTEIISLDENYENMFVLNEHIYVGHIGKNEDFIIVTSTNYDENFNYLSTDYFYINKNNPEKLFLFNDDKYYEYELKAADNENEFILSTDGSNHLSNEKNEAHNIICKTTENGIITEKITTD